MPERFEEGANVLVWWPAEGVWYDGVVEKTEGDSTFVRYVSSDDSVHEHGPEWTIKVSQL